MLSLIVLSRPIPYRSRRLFYLLIDFLINTQTMFDRFLSSAFASAFNCSSRPLGIVTVIFTVLSMSAIVLPCFTRINRITNNFCSLPAAPEPAQRPTGPRELQGRQPQPEHTYRAQSRSESLLEPSLDISSFVSIGFSSLSQSTQPATQNTLRGSNIRKLQDDNGKPAIRACLPRSFI